MYKIQNTVRSGILLFIFLLTTVAGYSQPFEIRTVNKGLGLIGVEMRVTGGTAPRTTDLLTDIVFGIKWDASYGVDLNTTLSSAYNINRSGTRALKNGFHFQAFYADPIPFAVPANWVINNWVEILSISNNGMGTGTGSFAIAEPGFDPVTDPNFGINLIDYSPAIFDIADGVLLPVKLANFEVVPGSKMIKVQWSTFNEQNSKGFEIQRSEDQPDDFRKAGWIDSKSKNNSNNQYAFVDKDVVSRKKYYYRLKQFDNDGRFSYSDLRVTQLDEAGSLMQISPNPVGDMLHVYFNSNLIGEVQFKIIDAKGSVLQSGTENVDFNKKVELNTAKLAAGQYFLAVKDQHGLQYTKAFRKK